MFATSIPSDLLRQLAEVYERDNTQFVQVPTQVLTSAVVREALAELRNNGYLEEELRGIVRFTARGYKALRREFGNKGTGGDAQLS